MNLPDKLLKLQERLRKAEKNPNLDVLVYLKNDYEKRSLSSNAMELKYSNPPINFSISSSAIMSYLKDYCHAKIKKGPYNTVKKANNGY